MNRKFKGVWIEKDFYFAKDLSWSEKILLIEIDSLDNEENKRNDGSDKGCFASNKHFADHLGLKEATVANMISRLIQRGMITRLWFDGRNRGLRAIHENLHKKVKQVHKKVNEPSQKSDPPPSQKNDHNNTYKESLKKQENKQEQEVCVSVGNKSGFLKTSNEANEYLITILDGIKARLNVLQLSREQEWVSAVEWCHVNKFTPTQFLECYDFLRSEKWRNGRITPQIIMDNLPSFAQNEETDVGVEDWEQVISDCQFCNNQGMMPYLDGHTRCQHSEEKNAERIAQLNAQ